jgi:hypothetical protein
MILSPILQTKPASSSVAVVPFQDVGRPSGGKSRSRKLGLVAIAVTSQGMKGIWDRGPLAHL